MNDDTRRDEDLGAPIAELAAPTETPGAGFMSRIRGSIDRRELTSQIVDYSIWGFFKTFLDYLLLGLSALTRDDGEKKERQ